jgi:HTH-type transcriptional regulator/antitoxin HigA
MTTKIENHDQYISVMAEIEKYIQKATQQGGFEQLQAEESSRLKELSLMAEAFEDTVPLMPIRKPRSIAEMLKIKMMQMNLKQKDMAKLLNIAESKLSDILTEKRRIDIDLAIKLYKVLKIEAEFLLETA